MKSTYISWARYQSRSASLAQQLGASMHFIHHGKGRRPWTAPVRYVVQARRTWEVLQAERPDTVFAQNPPLPLVLLVYLYCRLHGARYVIDSHTGAFLSPPWRQLQWLHRILSRRAVTTLVHNWAQAELVRTWDCSFLELIDCPLALPPGETIPLDGAFHVLAVCSYATDEPIADVIGVARLLPDVDFYLTGDHSRMGRDLAETLPANCHCTGYLPYTDYLRLMRSVDVVMVLTTRDGTLLAGAFEALALRRPLILSDWPVLRSYFDAGAIHAANDPVALADAVRRARLELPALEQGIEALAVRLHDMWQRQFAALLDVLAYAALASADGGGARQRRVER